jgi:hypothetical protein
MIENPHSLATEAERRAAEAERVRVSSKLPFRPFHFLQPFIMLARLHICAHGYLLEPAHAYTSSHPRATHIASSTVSPYPEPFEAHNGVLTRDYLRHDFCLRAPSPAHKFLPRTHSHLSTNAFTPLF